MKDKLIVLDRDGVINFDSDDYIKSVDEWIPIPGSIEAIVRLKQAGYTVVVLTNQSGIARGYYSVETLNQMHEKLNALLAESNVEIDGIYYCPHGPDDDCDCRKPRAGLFYQALKALGLSEAGFKNIPSIGDSWRDLEAALKVGAKPILVLTGKGARTFEAKGDQIREQNIPVFNDLASVVDNLI